jgi:hypothetical protein
VGRRFLLIFSVCLVSVPVWFVSAADGDGLSFVLETADGKSIKGPIRALEPDWRVTVNDGVHDMLALHRVGQPLPPLPTKNLVLFTNGDCIPVKRLKLTGEQLVITPLVGDDKEWRVPLEALALIWLTTPEAQTQPDKLRRALATVRRTRDQVLLRNGDMLEGTLAAMDDKAVRLEDGKKTIDVKLDKVAAIALSSELVAPRLPNGAYGRLVLANGCRLSLASVSCDGKVLSGRALFGGDVRIPLEQIVALYVFQNRAVYLSDLKPVKVEQVPYLDVGLPPVRDGSVKGCDLRLAGSVYDKGLGMHSTCRMTYDLEGKYKRFEALVGLDDLTGREGSVGVEIVVDGKPQQLALEKDLTHRQGPIAVRVDLRGAKQLTLAITFGERGDVQDDVDWVDARLVK